VAFLDQINRGAELEILPDLRRRSSRRYDITDWQATYPTIEKLEANVQLPWGSEDPDYVGLRLIDQKIIGQTQNPNKSPNSPPPYLLRVYEQIDENDRTQVGRTDISYDQYGRKTVVNEFIQFSDGTTVYSDVVGTSTAPAPNAECVLQKFEAPNDGTLIRWKLTYIDSGEMSDNIELRFGGKVLERTLTYLNEVPPAPSGYTYIGTSTEYVEGLPLYSAKYVAAAGGGTPGTAGQISIEYYNSQGGPTNFNYASPNSGDGATKVVIRYVTPQSTSSNPITMPSGFILVGLEMEEDTGYRLWTATGYFAKGLVVDEKTIVQSGALVIYHRVQFGAVPATPSATIGGTVTLFEDSVKNADGYDVYERRWAEANGEASIETSGEPDGAIVVQLTTLTAAASTPSSPGAGYYLIALKQSPDGGYSKNTATYKKPPADDTYPKTMEFEEPGIAEFTGSPPQFVLRPPKQRTLLVDVEVTYGTSKISTAPFEIEAYASFYETYTPTDTGVAVQTQRGLGGYLAQASGISGTNSNYNGVLCDSWSASLLSSIPSTFPTGLVTIKVDNDPYLTAIDGTKVYRRTVITYTF